MAVFLQCSLIFFQFSFIFCAFISNLKIKVICTDVNVSLLSNMANYFTLKKNPKKGVISIFLLFLCVQYSFLICPIYHLCTIFYYWNASFCLRNLILFHRSNKSSITFIRDYEAETVSSSDIKVFSCVRGETSNDYK